MTSGLYILDENHNPVETDNTIKWHDFFKDIEKRRVAKTLISDNYEVSTVFLAVDINARDSNNTLLFETLISGGERNGELIHYRTWKEAEEGHKKLVEELVKLYQKAKKA